MFIGSAAIAPPKPEVIAPKPAPLAKPPPPPAAVPQQLKTAYVPAPKANLVNLTGEAKPVADIKAKGGAGTNPSGNVPQAWGNTCGPNTLMAMEASVDSGRAAQLSGLTGDDRALYEAAVMNSNTNPMRAGYTLGPNTGGGWGPDQMRWQVADRFGGIDETLSRNDYSGRPQAAADAMVTALNDGRPVAIGLENHWMAATDIRGKGDDQEILIQDSWTGTSAWVPVSEIESGSNWVGSYFSGEGTGISSPSSSSDIYSLVVPSSGELNPGSEFRANEANALTEAQTDQSGWTRRDLPEQATPAPAVPDVAIPAPRWFNHPIAV